MLARRYLWLVALAGAGVGLLASSCAGADFKDRTAIVEISGERVDYQVDSCGLDGQTVFVVARSGSGAVLQAVMGLDEDLESALVESTGVTVDGRADDPTSRTAAFGAEAWQRSGEVGAPPGSIATARLRGSRIQVSGIMEAVTESGQTVAGSIPLEFSFDARCDQAGR